MVAVIFRPLSAFSIICFAGSVLQKSEKDLFAVEVQEGDTVSLLCEADSRPDPLLSWVKGNKTLIDPKQDKKHNLLLSKIRSEAAGLYQCLVKNLLGSAVKAVRVNVRCKICSLQGLLGGAFLCGHSLYAKRLEWY